MVVTVTVAVVVGVVLIPSYPSLGSLLLSKWKRMALHVVAFGFPELVSPFSLNISRSCSIFACCNIHDVSHKRSTTSKLRIQIENKADPSFPSTDSGPDVTG
jgi:hypothetical protein